ncbi:MAG: hypothetical protein AAB966_03390, partial [Patescibacteria group bacterium]
MNTKNLTDEEALDLFDIAASMKAAKVKASTIVSGVRIALDGKWEVYSTFRLWSQEKDKEYKNRIIGQIDSLTKEKSSSHSDSIKTIVISIPNEQNPNLPAAILYPKQFYAAIRYEVSKRLTLKKFAQILKEVDPKKKGLQAT